MASPSFGLTGNNAPLPPQGNWNPTGTNTGVSMNSGGNQPYPMFGAPSGTSSVTPSSNAPLWSGTSGGLSDLSSGFTGNQVPQNLLNELNQTYGSGMGNEINNLLTNGLFNPQIAAAFLNAMGPGNAQGLASVQNSFGAEGSRFGSAAALGIGNYESQVNLNEQSTLAGMYENAQTEQLQLLTNLMGPLQETHADQGGFMNDFADFYSVAMGLANLVTGPVPNVSQPIPKSTAASDVPTSTPNNIMDQFSTPSTDGSTVGSDSGTMNSGALDQYSGETSAAASLGGSSGLLGDTGAAGNTGGLGELAAFFA
jgi:hypothetical protein